MATRSSRAGSRRAPSPTLVPNPPAGPSPEAIARRTSRTRPGAVPGRPTEVAPCWGLRRRDLQVHSALLDRPSYGLGDGRRRDAGTRRRLLFGAVRSGATLASPGA